MPLGLALRDEPLHVVEAEASSAKPVLHPLQRDGEATFGLEGRGQGKHKRPRERRPLARDLGKDVNHF